jgi:hypothetical protein
MLARSIGIFNIFRRQFVKPASICNLKGNYLNIINKRIITLSPGGFKGFYMMGVCKYLKENYDLSNYIFSGASAGAWNSLLLSFKGDINEFQNDIISMKIQKLDNLKNIEDTIKKHILEKYTSDDFQLDQLYIGTTVFENFKLKSIVYTGFENLEDAVECCIASSHIPYITGGLKYKYRGLASFDGGFSEYPYLNNSYSNLHITPSIWSSHKTIVEKLAAPNVKLSDFTTLFSRKDYDMEKLIIAGYNDAKNNKDILDRIMNSYN